MIPKKISGITEIRKGVRLRTTVPSADMCVILSSTNTYDGSIEPILIDRLSNPTLAITLHFTAQKRYSVPYGICLIWNMNLLDVS